jgi:hypothetical protein
MIVSGIDSAELLAPGVFHEAHRTRAARLQTLVEILLVDGQRLQLLAPTRGGGFPVEPVLEVVDRAAARHRTHSD